MNCYIAFLQGYTRQWGSDEQGYRPFDYSFWGWARSSPHHSQGSFLTNCEKLEALLAHRGSSLSCCSASSDLEICILSQSIFPAECRYISQALHYVERIATESAATVQEYLRVRQFSQKWLDTLQSLSTSKQARQRSLLVTCWHILWRLQFLLYLWPRSQYQALLAPEGVGLLCHPTLCLPQKHVRWLDWANSCPNFWCMKIVDFSPVTDCLLLKDTVQYALVF